jgi:hypothetical protein
MVTFTINIPQMLAYIPYMDPMGYGKSTVLVGKSTKVLKELIPCSSQHLGQSLTVRQCKA